MLGARETAVKVLLRVEHNEAFAAAALEAELKAMSDPREISLANELVLGVLRRRPWLDHLLDSASKKGLIKIDPTVLNILRVAVYQLVFLERVPARAAVSEAVRQTERSRAPRLKGLVNALLRNLASRSEEEIMPPRKDDAPLKIIAMREGLPLWLFEKLAKDRGKESAIRTARAFNEPSPRTLRVCTNRIQRKDVLERLGPHGAPGRLLHWSVDVSSRSAARELVDEGLAVFQDEGAGLVALALDPQPNDIVLDACAGRGGKTGAMAAMADGQAHITATDIHSSKLDRLRFELKKQGLGAETMVVDLAAGTKKIAGEYNRILLDAPCSGTGTMGRRPEIRWRLKKEAVKSLVKMQRKMLDNVARLVAPGGRMVYAVCSLLPEECEGHLSNFLDSHPDFHLVETAPEDWPKDIPWNGGRPLVDPGMSGTDGYSILCLEHLN